MTLDSAIFYVKDLDFSIDFFVNTLGFTLEDKDASRYASFVLEDGKKLGIIGVKKEETDNPGHGAVKIGVTNARELYQKYASLGINFNKPYTEETWGKEFILLDPDNNKLIFVER